MTINNDTNKIEASSKGIPCTYYVGSSVGRIFLRIGFCFVHARDLMLLWYELLFTSLLDASLLLEKSFSWCPSLLGILSESCCIWNIFHSRSTLLLNVYSYLFRFLFPFCFCVIYSLLHVYAFDYFFRLVDHYLYLLFFYA